jgi:hypothetical protein
VFILEFKGGAAVDRKQAKRTAIIAGVISLVLIIGGMFELTWNI